MVKEIHRSMPTKTVPNYLKKNVILTFLFLIQPFPGPKSRSSVADPGCLSRIQYFYIPDPGSKVDKILDPDPHPEFRIQGVKKQRIPDPDPQHYQKVK
jgi:hypothetical protein